MKTIKTCRKISAEQLNGIAGGTVSPGPWYIDDIINGDNYKRIAEWLLKGKKEPRTRPVEKPTDIYDVEI